MEDGIGVVEYIFRPEGMLKVSFTIFNKCQLELTYDSAYELQL